MTQREQHGNRTARALLVGLLKGPAGFSLAVFFSASVTLVNGLTSAGISFEPALLIAGSAFLFMVGLLGFIGEVVQNV